MPTAVLEIKLDAKGAVTGIRNLEGDFKKLDAQSKKTTTSMQKLGTAIASAFAFDRLVAGFKSVLDAGVQFEQSIASLRAITGQGGVALDFLEGKARQLGATTTFTAQEVAKGFEIVGSVMPQLLNDSQALSKVTEEVLTLAEAAGTTLPQAAAALGNSMNQFALPAEDASRVVNALAAGARAGSVAIPELTVALSKAGVGAKGAGLSFEETVGSLELLGKMGLDASLTGTKFSMIMTRLTAQTRDEFNPSIVGLEKALENLDNANLSVTETIKLFNAENKNMAEFLIDNREQLSGSGGFIAAVTGTSQALEQAAIKTSTTQGALKTLGSAWEEVKLSLYDNNSQTISGVIKGITEWVKSLDFFVDRIDIIFAQVFNFVMTTWENISSGVKGIVLEMRIFVNNAMKKMLQGMKSVADAMPDFLGDGLADSLTNGINALNSGVDDLIERQQQMVEQYTEAQETRKGVIEQMEEELFLSQSLHDEQEKLAKTQKTLTDEKNKGLKSDEKGIKVLSTKEKEIKDVISALEGELAAVRVSNHELEIYRELQAGGAEMTREQAEQIVNLRNEIDRASNGWDQFNKQLDDQNDTVDELNDGLKEEIAKIKEERQQLGKSFHAWVDYNQQKMLAEGMSPDLVDAWGKQIRALKQEEEQLQETSRAAQEFQNILSNLIGDFLKDVFAGDIEEAFENLFDNILSSFTDMIAEMIAEAAALAVIQTYTNGGNGSSFGGNFMNALGGAAGTAGSTGATTGAGLSSGAMAGLGAAAVFAAIIAIGLNNVDNAEDEFLGNDTRSSDTTRIDIRDGMVEAWREIVTIERSPFQVGENNRRVDIMAADDGFVQAVVNSVNGIRATIIEQARGLGVTFSEEFVNGARFTLALNAEWYTDEEYQQAVEQAFRAFASRLVNTISPGFRLLAEEGEMAIDAWDRLAAVVPRVTQAFTGAGFNVADFMSDSFLGDFQQQFADEIEASLRRQLQGFIEQRRIEWGIGTVPRPGVDATSGIGASGQGNDTMAGIFGHAFKNGGQTEGERLTDQIQAIMDRLRNFELTAEELAQAYELALIDFQNELANQVGGVENLEMIFAAYTRVFVGAGGTLEQQLERSTETLGRQFENMAASLGTSRDTLMNDFVDSIGTEDFAAFGELIKLYEQMIMAEQQLALARGEALQLADLTALQLDELNASSQAYVDIIQMVTGEIRQVDDSFLQFILNLEAAGVTFDNFAKYASEFVDKFIPEEEKLQALRSSTLSTLGDLGFDAFSIALQSAFAGGKSGAGVRQEDADALRDWFRSIYENALASEDEALIAALGPLIGTIDELIGSIKILEIETEEVTDIVDQNALALAAAQANWAAITQEIQNASSVISNSMQTIRSASLLGGQVAGASPHLGPSIDQLRGRLGQGSTQDQINNILELQALITSGFEQEQALIEANLQAHLEMERRIHEDRQNRIVEEARARYEADKRRFDQEMANYRRLQAAAESIQAYLDDLRFSELAPGTPQDRLDSAMIEFQRILGLALSGDVDAMGEIQGIAQTVIDLAREVFASSEAFDNIFAMVTQGLEQVVGIANAAQEPVAPVWVEPVTQAFEQGFLVNNAVIQAANDRLAEIQVAALAELQALQDELALLQEAADKELEAAEELYNDSLDATVGTNENTKRLVDQGEIAIGHDIANIAFMGSMDAKIGAQLGILFDTYSAIGSVAQETHEPIVRRIDESIQSADQNTSDTIAAITQLAARIEEAVSTQTASNSEDSGTTQSEIELLREEIMRLREVLAP